MDEMKENLKQQLRKCCQIISKGYTNARNSGIIWLNDFCVQFLRFASELHKYVANMCKIVTEGNETVETIFLCLMQISTCIGHMESTIKAEITTGAAISSSRQHFLDRIHWCLNRLCASLKNLSNNSTNKRKCRQLLENNSFVELMDLALDYLTPYGSYNEDHEDNRSVLNVAEENAEAMFASEQIRAIVNLILSHTLAFANVTLKCDKKALSALCQKVLRECIAFQDECSLNNREIKCNESNRKLKAITLENALYQLEDYINEALLRLVYTTFLDYEKFSIEKLRAAIRSSETDDPTLDELIADFDVNFDRTIQIGIFAIAFAPDLKMKTIIRNCLASLESLDSCIIPSLQTKNSADIHSEILEQHFNEEISNFKRAIQAIIDSHTFTMCYHEILTKCILDVEKSYNKVMLQEASQMGEFLYEHFQLQVNRKELKKEPERKELFEKFTLILRECQAVLVCADQVDKHRIIKRFKILRAIVSKLLKALTDNSTKAQKTKDNQVFLLSDEYCDSQHMFDSIGISPSICSILYGNEKSQLQRGSTSDSLKAIYSKMKSTPLQSPWARHASPSKPQYKIAAINRCEYQSKPLTMQTCCAAIRRKDSIRTSMFKRKNLIETEKIYNIYKNNSTSLQITEILDRITSISAQFSNSAQLNGTTANSD